MHRRRLREAKGRIGSCSSLAQAHSVVTMEDTTSTHLWVGKDYVNWISKDLDNLDEPFKGCVCGYYKSCGFGDHINLEALQGPHILRVLVLIILYFAS